MATTYQFWQHKTSGELYAVIIDSDAIVGICGPVSQRDTREQPDPREYNFDQNEDIEWLTTNQDQFRLYTPTEAE